MTSKPPPPPRRPSQSGWAAPPRPPGDGDPRDRNPLAALDEKFPPHSKNRLILFIVATPVITTLITLYRGALAEEAPLWSWLILTIAAEVIVLGVFYQARLQATKREAPETEPPVQRWWVPLLAVAGLTLALLFLVAISDMWGPVSALSVLVCAGLSSLMVLIWLLRRTIVSLVIVSLIVGAVGAGAWMIFSAMASIWGSSSGDIDFFVPWIVCSAIALALGYPIWQQQRDFEFKSEHRIMAIVVGVATYLMLMLAFIVGNSGTG